VREILESLPEDECVAYTTVQTLVYRLEEKAALRKVKKIGNAQLFQPSINQSQYRSGLVRNWPMLFRNRNRQRYLLPFEAIVPCPGLKTSANG